MPRKPPDDAVLAAMPSHRPGITKRGLERKLGMTRQTIWRVTKRLHDEKRCHIGSWHRLKSGGPFNPRYVAGAGVDAICELKPQPQAVTQKRWKEKAIADGRYAIRNEKIKAKYHRVQRQRKSWLRILTTQPKPTF